MDDIWLNRCYVFYKLLRNMMRQQSLIVKQPSPKSMNIFIYRVSYMIKLRLAFVIPSTIRDIALPACFNDCLPEHLSNFAVRTPVRSNVYL